MPTRPATTARASGSAASGADAARATRRARLRVSHVNPLSVGKMALAFSLCMLVVFLVAIAVLWFVLDQAGVFGSIEDAASTLTDKTGGGITPWLSFGRVMLIAVIVGLVNVVAYSVLATIGAMLYNLCSDFVGGVEVTLSDR